MLVAKEMSISRAAQKAFVSQQCVSDHIKRMEQHYGVKLFTRKPRFQLTEAGASMFASLQKIQALEMSLQNHMSEYASGCRGSFTMGISASRAQVILPRVMPRYCRAFPNVEVRFFLNDTVVLEENLRKGEVDLFLGVNTRYSDDLDYRRLCEDDLCFMISRGLLREYFGEDSSACLAEHLGNHLKMRAKEKYGKANVHAKMEVDLREFAGIPFIKSYPTSVMNSILQRYLDGNHISLYEPYQISDTETQILLCAQGVGAAIGPRMLFSRIDAHNLNCAENEYIYVLPVKGLTETLRIDLVTRKGMEMPAFVRAFEEMVVEEVGGKKGERWMKARGNRWGEKE